MNFSRLRELVREINRMRISVYAGNASFFLLLSCLPLTSLLLALLPYASITQADLMALLRPLVPETVLPLFSYLTASIYDASRPAVISLSALATLWSASKGLHSILRGLNAVCGAQETRGYVRVRVLCALYTLGLVLSLVLTLAIHVWGKRLLALLLAKKAQISVFLIGLLRAPFLYSALLLTALFTVLYFVLPNRRQAPAKLLPGAAAAALCWLLFSRLFSIYVNHFSGASQLYGSLATLTLTMLWLYACLSILFYGAYLNILLFRPNGLLSHWKRRKKP